MGYAMGQMSQIGSLRTDLSGGLDRLFDVEVRAVSLTEPESIEHKDVDALQGPHRLVGQRFGVCDIAQGSHTKAVDVHASVGYSNRGKGLPNQRDWRPSVESLDPNAWLRAALRRLEGIVEDVLEVALQRVDVLRRNVGRHIASPHREGSEIVDTVDVVRVDVRKPDGIDRGDPGREELQPKLGRSVHQQPALLRFDESTVPSPAISRVGRRACGAIAPYDRYPERRTCAQEGQLHRIIPCTGPTLLQAVESHVVRRPGLVEWEARSDRDRSTDLPDALGDNRLSAECGQRLV